MLAGPGAGCLLQLETSPAFIAQLLWIYLGAGIIDIFWSENYVILEIDLLGVKFRASWFQRAQERPIPLRNGEDTASRSRSTAGLVVGVNGWD